MLIPKVLIFINTSRCRTPVPYPSTIPVVNCHISQRHAQSHPCMLNETQSRGKKILSIFEILPLGTLIMRLPVLQAKVPIRYLVVTTHNLANIYLARSVTRNILEKERGTC